VDSYDDFSLLTAFYYLLPLDLGPYGRYLRGSGYLALGLYVLDTYLLFLNFLGVYEDLLEDILLY